MDNLRLVVATAVIAPCVDSVEPITANTSCTSCFLFTTHPNLPNVPSGWEVTDVNQTWLKDVVDKLDSRRVARFIKICLPILFPHSTHTLWLDSNIGLNIPPEQLFLTYDDELVVFKHGQRSTLHEEMKECIALKKDDPTLLLAQYEEYVSQGLINVPLAETGIVLRRTTETTKQHALKWWHEVKTKSVRDQMSFGYACEVCNLTYATFDGKVRYPSPNSFWTFKNHAKV